jgi:hypothetical protein
MSPSRATLEQLLQGFRAEISSPEISARSTFSLTSKISLPEILRVFLSSEQKFPPEISASSSCRPYEQKFPFRKFLRVEILSRAKFLLQEISASLIFYEQNFSSRNFFCESSFPANKISLQEILRAHRLRSLRTLQPETRSFVLLIALMPSRIHTTHLFHTHPSPLFFDIPPLQSFSSCS